MEIGHSTAVPRRSATCLCLVLVLVLVLFPSSARLTIAATAAS